VRGLVLCVGLVACAPAPETTWSATLVEGGVEVQGSGPLGEVVVRDGLGRLVMRAPAGPQRLLVPVRPPPGASWTVQSGEAVATVSAPTGPVSLRLEAPRGQGGRTVVDGDVVEAWALGASKAALVVTAREAPTAVVVRWGGEVHQRQLPVVGHREVVEGPLVDGALEVQVDGEVTRIGLDVTPRTVEEARGSIEVVGEAFPTDPRGVPDATRPVDTLVLPPEPLRRGLRALGMGRARDDQAPWAHQSLTLHNHGDQPLDVVVEARVEGAGSEAFAPRVRDASGLDRVIGVARLPPGAPVTVTLPLYVDSDALQGAQWVRRWSVVPLGAEVALHEVDAPLYLRRGRVWTWLGFAAALGSAGLGWALLAWQGPRWLRAQPTSDLVTIALFGALSYVVAGVLQVVGHGVSALLGPFAPLLTGLPDDALRACLLATLLTLLPRPGVAALATVTGALLRGLTLGSFHPVDLLYVGSVVFWLEASLWLVGLTRAPSWRDGSWGARWLRVSLGLGLANVAAVATGLCVAAALYRLYYAAWYVALLLAVPGFLYVAIGCAVAVDLAASLRRVAT